MDKKIIILLIIFVPIAILILISTIRLKGKTTIKRGPKKMVIIGVNGKMGKMLYQHFKEQFIICGVDLIDVPIKTVDINEIWTEQPQVLVDFSHYSVSKTVITEALKRRITVISGTTGYNDKEKMTLVKLAKNNRVSLIMCSNYAEGFKRLLAFVSDKHFSYENCVLEETSPETNKKGLSDSSKTLAKVLGVTLGDVISYRDHQHFQQHHIRLTNNYEETVITHQVINQLAYLPLINAYLKLSLKKEIIVIDHQNMH